MSWESTATSTRNCRRRACPNLQDTDELPSVLQKFAAQRADWSELQWREYLWVYYRLVEQADTEAGRVLAELGRTGLDAKTVVVFTSDHGEMMGSHRMVTKQKLYEESVAVPLIVAQPGTAPAVDTQHLVSGLDVLPTLLDYAGIASPASLEGRSLRPLVELIKEPLHGVDWYPTLVRLAGGSLDHALPVDGLDIWPVLTEGARSPHDALLLCGMAPGRAAIRKGNWKLLLGAGGPEVQLYDLDADIGETTDLAAERPEKVKELKTLLDRWLGTAVPPGDAGAAESAGPRRKRNP